MHDKDREVCLAINLSLGAVRLYEHSVYCRGTVAFYTLEAFNCSVQLALHAL